MLEDKPLEHHLNRIQRWALIAGVAGLLTCAIWAFLGQAQFFRAIMSYFMYLRHSSRLVLIFAMLDFFWIVMMFLITMADYVARA